MRVRILDCQSLSPRSALEFRVSRYQGEGKLQSSTLVVDPEGGSQLHGIVTAQAMGFGYVHRASEKSGRDVYHPVGLGKVLTEVAQDYSSVLR